MSMDDIAVRMCDTSALCVRHDEMREMFKVLILRADCCSSLQVEGLGGLYQPQRSTEWPFELVKEQVAPCPVPSPPRMSAPSLGRRFRSLSLSRAVSLHRFRGQVDYVLD